MVAEAAKVLIVEDELIIAKDIEARLRDLGYLCLGIAKTGQQAVEMALSLLPAIILMDIVLKGKMDGIEAAREIKDRREIPVIFVSGNIEGRHLERIRSMSGAHCLCKPVDTRVLDAEIKNVLVGKGSPCEPGGTPPYSSMRGL